MIALKSRDPPHAMLFTKEFDPTLSCPSKQETILSRKYTQSWESMEKCQLFAATFLAFRSYLPIHTCMYLIPISHRNCI